MIALLIFIESLVKNLGKGDFRYFGQEVDVNAINFVKHKGFCHDEYMPDFENVKQQLPSKETFYIR